MNIALLDLSSIETHALKSYVRAVECAAYGQSVPAPFLPQDASLYFKKYANYISQPFEIVLLMGSSCPRRETFVVKTAAADQLTVYKLEEGVCKLVFPDKAVFEISQSQCWFRLRAPTLAASPKVDLPPSPAKAEDTKSPQSTKDATMGSDLSIFSPPTSFSDNN